MNFCDFCEYSGQQTVQYKTDSALHLHISQINIHFARWRHSVSAGSNALQFRVVVRVNVRWRIHVVTLTADSQTVITVT